MAEDDLRKPWWRSWTKWSVIATVALALPSFLAGGAWAINWVENRGMILASRAEADQILAQDHTDIQSVKASFADGSIAINDLKVSIGAMLDAQHGEESDIKKILWYLIEDRNSRTQGPSSRPSQDVLAGTGGPQ